MVFDSEHSWWSEGPEKLSVKFTKNYQFKNFNLSRQNCFMSKIVTNLTAFFIRMTDACKEIKFVLKHIWCVMYQDEWMYVPSFWTRARAVLVNRMSKMTLQFLCLKLKGLCNFCLPFFGKPLWEYSTEK